MRIPSGTTDQYIYFVGVDSSDFQTRETGLSSFTVYRSRNGAAAAAMTTPTINETDSSNMPGVYELLLDEDMTIDSGDDSQEMIFHITHTGMAPVTRTIELYRPKITAGNTLGVASDGDISGNLDGTVATVTTLTGHTAQTGDNYARLGAPAGASVSADIATIDGNVDSILVDTAEIGAAGAGLTNINLPNQTMDITGNITGNLSGSVGSVTATTSADVVSISGDSTAANNLELDYDGTGYNKSNSTIGTCTANTDMRGTDNAALASVLGALADSAAAGDPTASDTLVQYVKQIVNVLVGATGVTTYPSEAAPANNVSFAEILRAIHADVTGLNGDVMRGTNSAALATVCTEARLAELDAANLPSDIDAILTDTADMQPKLGSPAGASISADIATVDGNVDAILIDTADIQPKIGTPAADLSADIAAVKVDTAATLVDTAEIGTAGAGLTDVGGMSTAMKAEVNAEVVDVLRTDTTTLPGQEAPPLAPTMEEMIAWLYKTLRNRTSQTASQWSLYADDESTVDAKATVSDDGTTAIKQEIVTGP